MSSPTPLAAVLSLLAFPALSAAYSWNFKANPQQCSNLTISISGSDGKPPYRVLIIPFGPSPLPNNVEARTILDMPFEGNSNTISFQLKYPANSQLVAVVSDSTGFGSGGTSVAAQVATSSDASCFNATANVSPSFVFSIYPPNQIVQCQNTRLGWDNSTVQGIPNFLGVIPGGQSFAVPEPLDSITNVDSEGTGFTWLPNLRGGTTLLLIAGDNRGNGTGGSSLNTVSTGTQNIGTCLNSTSPSSTPGSPAGGSYATSTNGSWTGGGSGGGSTNTAAIVGGVIGGVVLLLAVVLLLLFFRRREKLQKRQKERPVDLLNAEEDGDEDHAPRQNELPQYYRPEPFMVSDTLSGTGDGYTTDGERPLSGVTTTTSYYNRSATPEGSAAYGYGAGVSGSSVGGRKGGMRPLRPVNIIQHDDAGPSEPKEEEGDPETIELPPAYTAMKKAAAGGGGGETEA